MTFTFDPGTSKEEIASITSADVTVNADGTVDLINVVRGLKEIDPYTTGGFATEHASGAVVVFSNNPQLYGQFPNKHNTNTFDLLQTFTVLPESDGGNATTSKQLVTYAQALALATGTASINRTVVAGTAGETLVIGNLVYLKESDGRWWKCDADTTATVNNIILGLAQGAGAAAGAVTNGVLLFGLDSNQTGLTTNTAYYASNTAGSISSTVGTVEVSVGFSQSTTSLIFYPRYNQQLTEDQQDALVGTSGTPSSSNKYVTNDDTSGTGLVVRASALSSLVKFGGNGADGALTVSSGTTNIDLGSSAFVVKNYTSISITGTGKVTFTNPASTGTIIVLKSQGAVTLTSSQTPMLDCSVLGAAGTATFTTTTNANNNGSDATTSLSNLLSILGGKGSAPGAVGAVGSAPTLALNNFSYSSTREKYLFLPIATGGGQGMSIISSNVSVTVGASGRGGGTLVIECAGAWNFTTTGGISVAGGNAVNSTSANLQSYAAGSGGGAGGYFLGLYGTLTANTGTVTVTPGTGATSDPQASGGTRHGAGGGSLLSPGNAGTSSATASVKTGGDGATGVSVIQANTDFA